MARVTVEDCIEVINDRFDLIAVAAKRAKQIGAGNPITVDRDNDKDAVVALREIADKTIEPEKIREEIIADFRRNSDLNELDEIEDDDDIQASFADETKNIRAKSEDELEEEAEEAGMHFSEEEEINPED